jgi:hypothetical protein
MSKIALKSNPLGTGTFTIESPNSNTDRTVVLPDGNGDVVLTDATQTLTNKSISAAQINSGTLVVARGGTGASTLTANNVLLGNGTSALQAVAPGTSGNVLTSNGTTWTSAAPGGGATDVQTFNANGTWTKPSTGSMARIQVWGGGGGAGRGTDTTRGTAGGGGGYNEVVVPLSTLGATVSVTVGAGGAGRSGSTGNGTGGGQTSFGSHCTAYGGGAGLGDTFDQYWGGGGGGQLSAGGLGIQTEFPTADIGFTNFGEPRGSVMVVRTGAGATNYGLPLRPSNWHGGAGFGRARFFSGADLALRYVAQGNMHSTYGGGGGGISDVAGGSSVYGGNGGTRDINSGNGVAPAGGGAYNGENINGGSGAAGRVIVTVW